MQQSSSAGTAQHRGRSASLINDTSLSGPLSQEQLNSVHTASVTVLARTGFRFLCAEVRDDFKKRGFRVEGDRVYFQENDILRALDTIPKNHSIQARNRTHDIQMNSPGSSFGLGRGAVHVVDVDGSYRSATMEDAVAAYKLGQVIEIVEHTGPLFIPAELDEASLYIKLTETAILYTDKAYNIPSRQCIDLVAIAYGMDRRQLVERSDLTVSPGYATCIVDSPLTITKENCDNLREYVRCGIAFNVASMPVACTTGPCSVAGTIVQQNVENLAPIVFSQLLNPGCPAGYGAIAGNADMKSLRPRFGTPETRIIQQAGCQMSRMYGLFCRSDAGLTDSPGYDFQSGAQAMLSTLVVVQNRPRIVLGCGLLGSYMGGSLAKVILDTEMINIANRYFASRETDGMQFAAELIDDAGPGGSYIALSHTLDNFRLEFAPERLFSSPDYERWRMDGRRDAAYFAWERAMRLLDLYETPPIDQGLKEEVDRYMKAHVPD